MLGRQIRDPHGIEGPPGSTDGLGLLELETTLAPKKQLENRYGYLAFADAPVAGYEIHAGVTQGAAPRQPALQLERGPEGALSTDGQILGTYLHGLFDRGKACDALLAWASLTISATEDQDVRREATLERLADAVEAHLDTRALLDLLSLS